MTTRNRFGIEVEHATIRRQNNVRPAPTQGVPCATPTSVPGGAGVIQHQHQALYEDNLRLTLRVAELEAAIRQHRDERGDDRCHADDGRLYAVLPEGDTRPAHETAVTLDNCARYIACRQTGREYVSPQRRIEELEAANARLRSAVVAAVQEISSRGDQYDTTPAITLAGLYSALRGD